MQEKNNNRTAGLSLPMRACRNGQRVHWVSWPAPELCTERPGWWNPRCLQTGCWGREREVDRWAEAGRETLLIHSYDQASRCRFSVYDSGLLTLRQAAEYRFDLKVFVCVCVRWERATVCSVFVQCCNWMCVEALHLWGLSYLGFWWLSIPSLVLISRHFAKPLYPLLTLWVRISACVRVCVRNKCVWIALKKKL